MHIRVSEGKDSPGYNDLPHNKEHESKVATKTGSLINEMGQVFDSFKGRILAKNKTTSL
jgi:hypothetical protein